MIKYIAGLAGLAVWLFFLRVLNKSKLNFWHFLAGSAGAFILMLLFLQPVLTQPLARIVALLAGLPGKIGDIYSAHYKYGVIFIESAAGAISLKIDFECSGIIEILAYLSLLIFYRVYTVYERVYVGVLGVVAIVLANALRITVISLMIYFGGVDMYHIAHTFIGRFVFYGLSVILYFYVFTKPQIIKQKVGSFQYDGDK
ncbi:MAG: exosortase family protein XrtG [Lachnospiraceae bacterium]|jgi:exosortase family protein XrtG|nr:exosortase family protein XrtG [Lachnospiraceae bacterium]MCI8872075.1 exosortase family protein XrtG [Lachnospiraceae bacterium]